MYVDYRNEHKNKNSSAVREKERLEHWGMARVERKQQIDEDDKRKLKEKITNSGEMIISSRSMEEKKKTDLKRAENADKGRHWISKGEEVITADKYR